MFEVFGKIGHLLRSLFAFGFAAFWGYWAYSWNEMGEFGPGKPTVIGVGLLALFAGIGGLVALFKVFGSATKAASPTPHKPDAMGDARRDQDADEIIARYMARRESEGSPPEAPLASAPEPTIQRPQFGRKQP